MGADMNSNRESEVRLERYEAAASRLMNDVTTDQNKDHTDRLPTTSESIQGSTLPHRHPPEPDDQPQAEEVDRIQMLPNQKGCMLLVEPLRTTDLQPSYAQELAQSHDRSYNKYHEFLACVGLVLGSLGSIPGCICFPNKYQRVDQGNVGMIAKFGKFYKTVDPGVVKINPMTEKLTRVDVRLQTLALQGFAFINFQDRCTTVFPDFAQITFPIWYIKRRYGDTRQHDDRDWGRVVLESYKATFAVDDVRTALNHLAQSNLRSVIGSRDLQEVISNREAIGEEVEMMLEGTLIKWGVEVDSVLIKDLVFPKILEDSLALAAHHKRMSMVRTSTAQAEVDSAVLMRKAADILSSPEAMHLKQLETYQAMSKDPSTKILIFPNEFNSGMEKCLSTSIVPVLREELGGSETRGRCGSGSDQKSHTLSDLRTDR